MINLVHHVAITIHIDEEKRARDFYCGVLELREVEKPPDLKTNGGLWLQVGNLQVHLSIQNDFDPSQSKGHIAYQVNSLSKTRDKLIKHGLKLGEVNQQIPGYKRFDFRDPFGNRVELLEMI